jgi:prevent-host-death family protein
MTEVGTFEAKNRLSELLDRVERGERIVIKRRGKAIAQIIPFSSDKEEEAAAEAAFQRIRRRAKAAKLGRFNWKEWKTYRDAGRR